MAVTIEPGTGVFEGGWVVYDDNLRVGYHYTREQADADARRYRAKNAYETRRQNRLKTLGYPDTNNA